MGQVISLVQGRRKLRKAIPKPKLCDDCDEPIETARLQVQFFAKRCISCEKARERRHRKILAAASDRDIIIIKG